VGEGLPFISDLNERGLRSSIQGRKWVGNFLLALISRLLLGGGLGRLLLWGCAGGLGRFLFPVVPAYLGMRSGSLNHSWGGSRTLVVKVER